MVLCYRNEYTVFVCAPDLNCNAIAICVRKSVELMKHVYADGVVPGCGQFETKLSNHLKEFACENESNKLDDVKAAVVTAFAEALSIFPATNKTYKKWLR